MELRHLRYFLAVAAEGNFSRAAARLNMSQPPLTRQIKDLEAYVGTPLFARTTRKVTLTPAGHAFLPKARAALYESKCAVEEARRLADGFTAVLTVGFMSSVMLAEICRLVAELRRRHPSVTVKFLQMRSDQQLEAVMDDRIDVGFVDLGVDLLSHRARVRELDADLYMHERVWVAVPKKHRLEQSRKVSFDDLRGEDFAFLERHLYPAHYDTIIAACKKADFIPHITHHGEQVPTVLAYVAAKAAIAFVPECARRTWSEYVSFVPLAEPIFIDVHMITRRGRNSKDIERIREALVSCGQ